MNAGGGNEAAVTARTRAIMKLIYTVGVDR